VTFCFSTVRFRTYFAGFSFFFLSLVVLIVSLLVYVSMLFGYRCRW